MNERQQRLYYLTRRPAFLWKLVLTVLCAGLLGGLLVNVLKEPDAAVTRELLEDSDWSLPQWEDFETESDPPLLKTAPSPEVQEWLERLETDWTLAETFSRRVELIGKYHATGAEAVRNGLRSRVEDSFADAPEKQAVAEALLRDLDYPGDSPQPSALARLALKDPPPAGVYSALGVFWQVHGNLRKAAEAYAKVQPPEDEFGREKAVDLYLLVEDYRALGELARDPLYTELLDIRLRWRIATETYDWPQIFRLVVPVQYSNLQWGSVLLVGIAAVFWWLILLRLGQVKRVDSGTFWLSVTGFFLGVASTWLTILFILWQEQSWGLDRDINGVIDGLLFTIAGVGLREETAKLLLFLPLVPILLRRNRPLEMLIVAGSVGLGFAAEENLGYVQGLNLSAGTRFITANFFHIVLTGSIGYAFCRACQSPARHLGDFFGVFTLMVVAHGVYNALMMIPELVEQGAGYFSMTVFIYLSWQFFGHVHTLRTTGGKREVISTTAIFLFGLSLLLALTLVTLCFLLPLPLALQIMMLMGAETGLICIMYIREFREVSDV